MINTMVKCLLPGKIAKACLLVYWNVDKYVEYFEGTNLFDSENIFINCLLKLNFRSWNEW